MRRSKTRAADNVRVIRDIRNSNRDYWISKERAKELFDEGKLVQVQAYANKWCYATKNPEEYYV
jgi:hypothetical protein